jgi:hypothetical protein
MRGSSTATEPRRAPRPGWSSRGENVQVPYTWGTTGSRAARLVWSRNGGVATPDTDADTGTATPDPRPLRRSRATVSTGPDAAPQHPSRTAYRGESPRGHPAMGVHGRERALPACPPGGIGRRARFRSVYRKVWEFDSPGGHQERRSGFGRDRAGDARVARGRSGCCHPTRRSVWGYGATGSASALQAEGSGFESPWLHHGPARTATTRRIRE